MFVTYDLPQSQKSTKQGIVRGAKEVSIQGEVLGWEIGEFDTGAGKKAPGVQVNFRKPSQSQTLTQIIEVPAHAQNVQFHLGPIPKEYQSALNTAA